jgi:thiosulfate/3-mercaptopyruvate sulfurtransferase
VYLVELFEGAADVGHGTTLSGKDKKVKDNAVMDPLTLTPPDNALLIDTRPAEEFARGHLAGAVHLDLWGVSLIDTDDAPLRAFMWMIGHLFSLRGVTPERPVVVYENNSGMRAARAHWFLEYLGHPAAQVLDGGYAYWVASGRPVTTECVAPTPSTWHGTADPSKLATWRQVFAELGKPETTIVDTRSDAEYYGEAVRAKRGGAIPGAVHLEWTNNLQPDGRFKPVDELRAMYESRGVTPDKQVMTYCQGGYRAAHAYLALRILGYPHVRNYTGSWKEWGDRLEVPVEVPRRT